MQGKGQISPATTPELSITPWPTILPGSTVSQSRRANYVVRNDVWIRADGTTGGLTVGYGSGSTQIGPELGFGHRIGGLNEDRVLIVKVAKGGKNLATISCHRVPVPTRPRSRTGTRDIGMPRSSGK